MIKKKKFGLGIFLLAILAISVTFMPSASAKISDENANSFSDNNVETYDIEGLTPEKVNEIEAEVNRIKDMPDTVKKCPYMPLLVANDEEKEIFLGYINNLTISDSEKKEMKKEIKAIWKRVPDKITEEDYPVMEKIGKSITTYVEDTYWAGDQSVKWKTYAHRNLIYAGVNLVYTNSTRAKWAYGTSMDPDTKIDTGTIKVLLTITPPIWVSIPKVCYYHYYNPDISFGGAPGKCSSYATQARTDYRNKDYENAFKNLGIASHYLSDVGQPMHSGGELGSLKDYLVNWNSDDYHIQYETYVDNNWEDGHEFGKHVTQNTEIKSVTDPSSAVKSMAEYSNDYSSKLWDEIYAHPDFNDPDSADDTTYIQYITIIMNKEAAKYNAGLAKYLKS